MASSNRVVRANFRGLNDLVKAMSDKHVVKVGIMGSKAQEQHKEAKGHAGKSGLRPSSKRESGLTNAGLGAVHEFGSYTRGIPKRSWLRMPIYAKAREIVTFGGKLIYETVKAGSAVPMLRALGIACENAIQQAFSTGGFGRWAPDAPSTVAAKGSSAPLIDTAQLRRSVTSKVDDR